MTVGEAGNFLAYGFAPASIVSPLGVVALISNCVIAPVMLKERFRLRDFWGVVVAVMGAATVVLSAKQQEKKMGPHEIIDAITTIDFLIYAVITISLMAILILASPKYGSRTILIDLGLVGLFGMSKWRSLFKFTNCFRWLYSFGNEGYRIHALLHAMEGRDHTTHIWPTCCAYWHGNNADQIREQGTAAL